MIWKWCFNHIPDFVKILNMSLTSPGFFVDEMAHGHPYSSIPSGNSTNRMGILGNPWRIDDHGTFFSVTMGKSSSHFRRANNNFFGDGHLKVISLKHFMRCFLGGWRKTKKYTCFIKKMKENRKTFKFQLQIPTWKPIENFQHLQIHQLRSRSSGK